MKLSAIKSIALLFVFLSINIFPQLEEDWAGYKVSLPFIKILKVEPILKASENQVSVIGGKTHFDVVGFIYTIELTISISGESADFNKTIPIIFKTPTNEELIFIFNPERHHLKSNKLYDFVCEVKTKKKGYTQVGFLRKFSDSSKPIAVYENGLRLE
ncbi:MAG: hypothetical protein Q8M94_14540 [Ignavibacteria bacterium]|nr:hypothetical protein [Ignavibacteria bacterium]